MSMMRMLVLSVCGLVPFTAHAEETTQGEKPTPTTTEVYKETPQGELKLYFFNPNDHCTCRQRPAIVFFFGGGWNGGSPSQFYPHCRHLAEQGMVAIAAEYRIRSKHKTSPIECVKDGKSAVRWIRAHAEELGIDPNMIAAGGGSAGGHVAAATATLDKFDEEAEDKNVDSRPNALVLFNPVYDNSAQGYGYDRVKEYWRDFSPMHNLHKEMPPAIVFLGTKDKLIPVETAKKFQTRMKELGVRSELHLYEDQPHGFFNEKGGENPYYAKTVAEMDRFLIELGYIQK